MLRTDPCAETVSCAPVAPGHAREPDRVIDAPAAGTGRRTGPDRVVVPVRRLRSAEGGSPLPCGPAETRVPVPACSCGSLMFLDVSGALPPAARLDHPGEEPDHGARRTEEAAAHGGRSSWRCRAGFPHKESLKAGQAGGPRNFHHEMLVFPEGPGSRAADRSLTRKTGGTRVSPRPTYSVFRKDFDCQDAAGD